MLLFSMLDEKQLREAFAKVKRDILRLHNELESLRSELCEIRDLLQHFFSSFSQGKDETAMPAISAMSSVHDFELFRPIVPDIQGKSKDEDVRIKQIKDLTHPSTDSSTHPAGSTDNLAFYSLKPQNLGISTGNRGVSTDRQTNRQTIRHILRQITPQNLPVSGPVEASVEKVRIKQFDNSTDFSTHPSTHLTAKPISERSS